VFNDKHRFIKCCCKSAEFVGMKIITTDGQRTFSSANSLSVIESLYYIHVCITMSYFDPCVLWFVNKCYVGISRYSIYLSLKYFVNKSLVALHNYLSNS